MPVGSTASLTTVPAAADAIETAAVAPAGTSASTDVCLSGRLDASTSADVREYLLECLNGTAPGADLVVDLAEVDCVDMVGLGLLVGLHRQAQRVGRRLVLARVPARVMRLLAATRLRRILAVRDIPPGPAERLAPARLPDDAVYAV